MRPCWIRRTVAPQNREVGSVLEAEGGDEGLGGHLDAPEVLHALLALLLLLEELALPGHVAAAQLGGHVLAVRLHGLPAEDAAADGGLDRPGGLLPRADGRPE